MRRVLVMQGALGGLRLWPALSLALPVLFVYGLRLLGGAPLSLAGLGLPIVFVAAAVLLGALARPAPRTGRAWRVGWPGLAVCAAGVAAVLAYALTARQGGWAADAAAWALLAIFFGLLLAVDAMAADGRRAWVRWTWALGLALLAGGGAAALAQVEARFAEEEFFALVQALCLAVLWLLLRLALRAWPRLETRGGLAVEARAAWLLPPLLLAGGYGVMLAYQASFFPPSAPAFEGVSPGSPFVCGQAPAPTTTYTPEAAFDALLAGVAANEAKGPPELGMLALGTGESAWAEAFRESLLAEARAGRFAGPAGSVKFGQFEAALRAYYYPRVRQVFPGLFAPAEAAEVAAWFASINRRALTVEPVDWLYALAFARAPGGPYENQENGAGLLALLESHGLADPARSAENQAYLAREPRGWADQFRNTDDAIVYQPEWLSNAYFLALYASEAPGANTHRSFEWLLLQALPDGSPLTYNHPFGANFAGISALGARLTGDSRLGWLAGRAAEHAQRAGLALAAVPGAEAPVPEAGRAPTVGSCLLYGDSGVPTRPGPLAPDKLVFRDGWEDGSAYLLLNLRFTGWHRYKATGSVTLLYQSGALAAEALSGQTFAWLPTGRSLFRDKRVPRENLNGLLVGRAGLGAVVQALTGVGGPWAQDPPDYAVVEQFDTGPEQDYARIVLDNWRGWQQARSVHFFHGGPVVVTDSAHGPAGQPAAVAWQLAWPERVDDLAHDAAVPLEPVRLPVRGGEQPAEVVLVPITPGRIEGKAGEAGLFSLLYHPEQGGRLGLVTVFLTRDWVGAEVAASQAAGGLVLRVQSATRVVEVDLGQP